MCYKVNDREARLQLLAGLIDTSGYISCGGYKITQKRKALANDIMFLARSLGFAAYTNRRHKGFQTYYRTIISGDCSVIPVRISSKKAGKRKQVKDVLLTGIDVIDTGKCGEFYGFETDGNHLYLHEDFTVVHNSLALVGSATANVARGKKVLYISLEMDQDKIAARFDAQFADCPIDQLMESETIVVNALKEQVRDHEDKRMLVVKQFPPGGADVNTIRAYHSQMLMHGFKPDLLIVDYVGEMKDAIGIPTWESRYKILRDLRGFGVEQQHCTFTALQPNRDAVEAQQNGFIDESKLGASFNQNRPRDALWTINQTRQEK